MASLSPGEASTLESKGRELLRLGSAAQQVVSEL